MRPNSNASSASSSWPQCEFKELLYRRISFAVQQRLFPAARHRQSNQSPWLQHAALKLSGSLSPRSSSLARSRVAQPGAALFDQPPPVSLAKAMGEWPRWLRPRVHEALASMATLVQHCARTMASSGAVRINTKGRAVDEWSRS